MKVAMITAPESGIPAFCLEEIRAAGIDLVCSRCETEDQLAALAKDAQVVWMFGPNICLTPAVLDRLPACRALFRSGSGVDALPLARARELGLEICNTPESISESVAEHAVSLLFSLIRQIPQLDREVRSNVWKSGGERTKWHISRRTLGLVGYGRIARHVEHMVSGFSMKVLHYDPFAPDSVPLERLIRESDYISLHCPLTPETTHLIGAKEFAMMKKGALLVNTSRGPVVDEQAMIEALRNGTLAGAALDVLDSEPPAPDHPLLSMDQVILTPHVAAFSADFDYNFWHCSAQKLIELAKKY